MSVPNSCSFSNLYSSQIVFGFSFFYSVAKVLAARIVFSGRALGERVSLGKFITVFTLVKKLYATDLNVKMPMQWHSHFTIRMGLALNQANEKRFVCFVQNCDYLSSCLVASSLFLSVSIHILYLPLNS